MPPSQGLAIGSATTPSLTSMQTHLNSYQPQPLHNHQRTWIGQNIQERNKVTMSQDVLNNQHGQEESIMDLKIRIALLQNDLLHKERERVEAVKACSVIARAMSTRNAEVFPSAGTMGFDNAVSYPAQKWKLLEQEVKMLRKENILLWKRVDLRVDSDDGIHDANVRRRLVSEKRLEREMADKEEMSDDEYHRSPCRLPHAPQNQMPATLNSSIQLQQYRTSIDSPETGILPEIDIEATKAWGQNLDSRTTTAPNSPAMLANDNLHTQRSSQDVGIESLDEIIGSDSSDVPHMPHPQVLASAKNGTKHLKEEPGWNEDMKRHMNAMIPLQDLPAPDVLKTGFDTNGSFKGGDYMHTSPTGDKGFGRFSRQGSSSFSNTPSSRFSSNGQMVAGGGQYHPSLACEKHLRPITCYSRSCRSSVGEVPGFFRYGIQYVPSEMDSNYLRGIMISNLPKDIELRDVLARVRGGEVVCATLLDTEKLTGGLTAMIQFLHQVSAEEYLSYTKDHPFSFSSSNEKAEVTLLKTPTWPLTTGHYPLILKQRQTRCLAIPLFPKEFSIADLKLRISHHLATYTAEVPDIYTDEQETLHLEFSSMVAAHLAYRNLTKCQMYSDLKPIFTHDPCAGEVGELASPYKIATVRRNMELSQSPLTSSNSSCVYSKSEIKQRNKPTALPRQTITIPSFSGSNITTSSWADEVIEEAENEAAGTFIREGTHHAVHLSSPVTSLPPNYTKDEGSYKAIHAVLMENTNKEIALDQYRPPKPPLGLSGSKFASTIPRFLSLYADPKSAQRTLSMSSEREVNSIAAGENILHAHSVSCDDIREPATSKYDENKPDGNTEHPPKPLIYSSSMPPADVQTAIETRHPQTPPCVSIDSVIDGSPSTFTSTTNDKTLNEQNLALDYPPSETQINLD
ncbi:hypothetical protein OIDMADRAFT_143392 [Oidiodendron maius Zn]|uniref:RRM domain-containing protein n=1 Tax=Oidiodendron maius (strain Zn) TaxID=913774 RepID=A0A0C3DPC2_OIDMZ|nr:hypothetical protein OIDMADRAFT_143392 [Oidiodendron maius Zn]